MTWLPLYALFYAAVAFYWAHVAARLDRDERTFFSAGHSLSPWISALVLAGMSLSGWVVLVGSAWIGEQGFGLPAVLQAGIAFALPGVLFFKRIWLLGRYFRQSSIGELFRSYWESEFLVAVVAVVATVFAVAFAGMQLLALTGLVVTMSDGAISAPVAATLLGLVLAGYVIIGGMRVVGYFGALQAVLAFAAILGFAGFAVIETGGFAALNAGLAKMTADPASSGRFIVAGVVQFTAGVGREAAVGHEGTALANFSFLLALMGLQACPMALKVVLSTREPRGLAAGQTWVMAGAGGALIALCMACLGAAGLIDPGKSIAGLLSSLSPWFGTWLFIGLLAGVQLMAGLALLVAAESLVRHVYKPWFHGALTDRGAVTLTRIVVAVLALVSVLMQQLTPVTLSMLGALALPLALQLWTPLLGMTWLRWFTGPAVVTGVGFGIAGVLLTEPFGIMVLSSLGLDLPWGRAPWTIHSAAWGFAANLSVTLLISAFTQRRAFGEAAQEAQRFFTSFLRPAPRVRALRSTAWSVALAWFFLAAGPGLVFGNYAFVGTEDGWSFGMPSLWVWSMVFWIAGVGLVWFLSYKMEMASPLTAEIPAYQSPPRLSQDQSGAERRRLFAFLVTVAVGTSLVVLAVLAFGQ